MSIDRDEIRNLLSEIDKYTHEIHYLKTTLAFEKEKTSTLKEKIDSYEKSTAKREHTQSRMMIHQESLVRDMGRELDSISAQLKSRYEEKIDWEKRYNNLMKDFEELAVLFDQQEDHLGIMNQKLTEQKTEIESYKKKGEQLLELTRLYDTLKRRFLEDEQKRELANTQVSQNVRRIWGHYHNLRSNLAKSENVLKKDLSKSTDIIVSYRKKKVGLHKELEQVWSENLFLKQDIMTGLKSIIDYMKGQGHLFETISQDAIRANLQKENKWVSPKKNKEQQPPKPVQTTSVLKGSNVSFSNNMNPPQSHSVPRNQIFPGSSSKTAGTLPPIQGVSPFDSIDSHHQGKHVRSKSVNTRRNVVSHLDIVRKNKMRFNRRKSSAWVSENSLAKNDIKIMKQKKVNYFQPNKLDNKNNPIKQKPNNQTNTQENTSFERKNKFERTESLTGIGSPERAQNLDMILSQNLSTQQDFGGETFQQKEKITGEFKSTSKEKENKMDFVISYENQTKMVNSKYLSNPKSPHSLTITNPKVWSPSHKNTNSFYLQNEKILSPNRSINEKNKELNTKISRLLEYIKFDQIRRKSMVDRDPKKDGALAGAFASGSGFCVRNKVANESINPFRSEIQSSPLEIGICQSFVFPKSHSSLAIFGTKPKTNTTPKRKKLLLAKDRDSLNGIKRNVWNSQPKSIGHSTKNTEQHFQNSKASPNKSNHTIWNTTFNDPTPIIQNLKPPQKNEVKKWSWENHPYPGNHEQIATHKSISTRQAQTRTPNAFLDDEPPLPPKSRNFFQKTEENIQYNKKPIQTPWGVNLTNQASSKANHKPNNNTFTEHPSKNHEIGSFGDDFKPNQSEPRNKINSPTINKNISSVNAFLADCIQNLTIHSKHSHGENLFTSQSKSNISSKPDNHISPTHHASTKTQNIDRKTSIEHNNLRKSKHLSASFKEMKPEHIQRLDQRALELKDETLNVSQTHFENDSPIATQTQTNLQENAFKQDSSPTNKNFTQPNRQKNTVFNSFNSNMHFKETDRTFETIGNLLKNADLKSSNRNSKRSVNSTDKRDSFANKQINGNFFKEDSVENKKGGSENGQPKGGFLLTLGEDLKVEKKIHSFEINKIENLIRSFDFNKINNQINRKQKQKNKTEIDFLAKLKNQPKEQNSPKKNKNFFKNNLNTSFENLGAFNHQKSKNTDQTPNSSHPNSQQITQPPKIKHPPNLNINFNNSFNKNDHEHIHQQNQKIDKIKDKQNSEKKSPQSQPHLQIQTPRNKLNDIFGQNESQLESENEKRDIVPQNLDHIKKSEKFLIIDQRHAEIMKTTIQREISFEMKAVNHQLLKMEKNQITPEQRKKVFMHKRSHLSARRNLKSLMNEPMITKAGGKHIQISQKQDVHFVSPSNTESGPLTKIPLNQDKVSKIPIIYGDKQSDKKNVFGIAQNPECISKSMPEDPGLDNTLAQAREEIYGQKALSVKIEKPPRILRNKPKKTRKNPKNPKKPTKIPKKEARKSKKRKTAKSATKIAHPQTKSKIFRNSRAKSVSKANVIRRNTAPRKHRNRKRDLKIDLSNTEPQLNSRDLNPENDRPRSPASKSPYTYRRNLKEERDKFKLEQLNKQEKNNKKITQKAMASQKLRNNYMKQWARKENPEHSRRKKKKRSMSKKQRKKRNFQKSVKNKAGLKNLRSFGRVKKNSKINASTKSARSRTEKSERAESLYEAKRRSAKETKLKKHAFKNALSKIIAKEKPFFDHPLLSPNPNPNPKSQSSISKPVPLPPFGTNDQPNSLQVPKISDLGMASSQDPQEQSFYIRPTYSIPETSPNHTEPKSNPKSKNVKNIFTNQHKKRNSGHKLHKTDPSIKTISDLQNQPKRGTYNNLMTSIGDSRDHINLYQDKKGNLIYNMGDGLPTSNLTDSGRNLNQNFQSILKSDQINEQLQNYRKYSKSGRSIRNFTKPDRHPLEIEMEMKFQEFQVKKKANSGKYKKKNNFEKSDKNSQQLSMKSKGHYKLYNQNKQNEIKFQSSRTVQNKFNRKPRHTDSRESVNKKRSKSKKSSYSQKFKKKTKRSKNGHKRKNKKSIYSDQK